MADPMQQARELLPCPFCGGEATLTMVGNVHSTRKCIVKCSGCRYQRTDAALRYGDEWLRNTAIAAWNRRVALRAAPEGLIEQHARDSQELRRLCQSRDFYKQRCEALQAVQPNMRDPERKAVCDILANGSTSALAARPQGVR